MNEKQLFKEATKELQQEAQTLITLELTISQAMTLVSQLQLASRHPRNTGPSAKLARAWANQIIEKISKPGSAARRLFEMGWDSRYDY